ncbi:MAG: NAD-dependent dehydratase [Planctomycetota bacterium]|nr:MAG: NAD-dependent dehydratase [Planctomycetota bacterium]
MSDSRMIVFVLGGRGFVGSAFVRWLTARDIACEIVSRDNWDAFAGRRCDVLINAAGNSKKFLSDRDPAADFDATVRATFDSLHRFKFDRYVLCSSCDVYDDYADPGRTREDAPIDPMRQSRYGFHKQLAEHLVRYEANQPLIIRFGGFVGPGLKKNPIFDILRGGPLWLHPDSRLQYLHTDEAARIVWQLVESGRWGETVNVCGDGVVRLADVIARVGQPVTVQPDSPTVHYEINIDKLRGWMPVPRSEQAVFAFVDAEKQPPRG